MSKVPEVTPTLLDWHLPAARPYLIADHMSCHFHATAGVGATQDKMVITVFGLAAGVPESQACDGALESLTQGRSTWSGGPAFPQTSLSLLKRCKYCSPGLER